MRRVRIRYRITSTVIVIIIVVGMLNVFLDYRSDVVRAPLIIHTPIYINGNDNFTVANGVVAGNGTQGNPYIIEGWRINASAEHGIWIENTDKYFIIRNCSIYDGRPDYHGVYLVSVYNGKIEYVNSTNNWNGIMLEYSHENIISNNVYNKNSWEGIWLDSSSYNEITNNMCTNSQVGIVVDTSTHNNVTENNCFNHNEGIYLLSSINNSIEDNFCHSNHEAGFVLYKSSGNMVRNNLFTFNNNYGIWIWSSSNENTITCNNISNNIDYGIHLSDSDMNYIYHNNLFDNNGGGIQANDTALSNYWNDSYPSGGNYWSDYAGFDDFKGPNQDQPGSDGIGDINYSIDGGSVDNYPLMEPFRNPRIYLEMGWNLISIPWIQVNTSIESVLHDLKDGYDSIQYCNRTDPTDPWKHYHRTKPSLLNDLHELNHRMGFWIYIPEPEGVIFDFTGIRPSANQSITLHPGWNMVGYPSLSNKNRTAALNNLTFGAEVDSIWTFNAASQTWVEIGPSDSFELGRGYWIHATQECVWEVPL